MRRQSQARESITQRCHRQLTKRRETTRVEKSKKWQTTNSKSCGKRSITEAICDLMLKAKEQAPQGNKVVELSAAARKKMAFACRDTTQVAG